MYARKAASEEIVYNAYGRNLFHQNIIHLISVYHFLLQCCLLPFHVVAATCRVQ